MDELRTDVDGVSKWKETARWIKFEEDVDEGRTEMNVAVYVSLFVPSRINSLGILFRW